MIEFSPKQSAVFQAPYSKHKITLAAGVPQTGKSLAADWGFMDWMHKNFTGYDFGYMAFSVAQASTNIWKVCEQYLELHGIKYQRLKQDDGYGYYIESALGGYNRFIRFLGRDEQCVKALRGYTLMGLLVDEIVDIPEQVFSVGMERLSIKGARCVASCNPDGPLHWVKLDLIDTNPLCKHYAFGFEDNPNLDEEYVNFLKNTLKGIQYKRKFLGEWVASTGMVYPQFISILGDLPEGVPKNQFVSLDVATAGITHGIVWSKYDDTWWLSDEYYYNGSIDEQRSHRAQIAEMLDMWSDKDIEPEYYVVDPAALDFRKSLKRFQSRPVYRGINNIDVGLNNARYMMDERILRADKSRVPYLCKAVGSYNMLQSAISEGEDKPDKKGSESDGPDALRYGGMHIMRRTVMDKGVTAGLITNNSVDESDFEYWERTGQQRRVRV